MEGSQGGCTKVREGVQDLSAKNVIDDTPSRFTLDTTYTKEEMGKHFHGLHYRVTKGPSQGLYLHGDGQVDQICTLIFYSFRIQCICNIPSHPHVRECYLKSHPWTLYSYQYLLLLIKARIRYNIQRHAQQYPSSMHDLRFS
jgi:hypothetical protein